MKISTDQAGSTISTSPLAKPAPAKPQQRPDAAGRAPTGGADTVTISPQARQLASAEPAPTASQPAVGAADGDDATAKPGNDEPETGPAAGAGAQQAATASQGRIDLFA